MASTPSWKVTLMAGQGGILDDPEVRARVTAVLSAIDVVSGEVDR